MLGSGVRPVSRRNDTSHRSVPVHLLWQVGSQTWAGKGQGGFSGMLAYVLHILYALFRRENEGTDNRQAQPSWLQHGGEDHVDFTSRYITHLVT